MRDFYSGINKNSIPDIIISIPEESIDLQTHNICVDPTIDRSLFRIYEEMNRSRFSMDEEEIITWKNYMKYYIIGGIVLILSGGLITMVTLLAK